MEGAERRRVHVVFYVHDQPEPVVQFSSEIQIIDAQVDSVRPPARSIVHCAGNPNPDRFEIFDRDSGKRGDPADCLHRGYQQGLGTESGRQAELLHRSAARVDDDRKRLGAANVHPGPHSAALLIVLGYLHVRSRRSTHAEHVRWGLSTECGDAGMGTVITLHERRGDIGVASGAGIFVSKPYQLRILQLGATSPAGTDPSSPTPDTPYSSGWFRPIPTPGGYGPACFGSEGWGFESLRARSVLRQMTRPLTSGNAGRGLGCVEPRDAESHDLSRAEGCGWGHFSTGQPCVGMSWLCDPLTAACEQSEGQLSPSLIMSRNVATPIGKRTPTGESSPGSSVNRSVLTRSPAGRCSFEAAPTSPPRPASVNARYRRHPVGSAS